jgi:hypothetical protein
LTNAGLEIEAVARHSRAMASKTPKPTREERLAAKLRENLHRRKAQSRTTPGSGSEAGSGSGSDPAAEETVATACDDLSKPASKS